MIRSKRCLENTVVAVLSILFAAAGVWAKPATKAAGTVRIRPVAGQTTDKLLQMVPAESLFVVRVNNLDYTLNQTDQFLAGLSPVPIGVAMLARMQFANVLGSPELNGVNMAGSFAVFAVTAPGESTETNPPSNMFIGGLVPVTDYKQFISGNPNCSQPDEKGVSKITGQTGPAMLITQAGNFALVGSAENYDKLVAMAKSISDAKAAGLAGALDADETKLAISEPLWVYGNVQQASKVFGPIALGQIEQIKAKMAECEDPNVQGPMANPEAIMDMYAGLLETLMKETKAVTLTANPKPTALNLTVSVSAVPGTDMANMLVAEDEAPKENKLLGYLEDGAMMNFACQVNKTFWNQINDKGIDLMAEIAGESMTSEDTAKWKTLATDAISSMGGSMVCSFSVDAKNKPPFAFKYVMAVEDEKTFNRVIEEAAEMMNTSGIADFYKKMGMEIGFTIKRDAGSYKGVSIDSAKFTMKSVDANSPQGQMINAMYGDGFDYRWAIIDGLCVYAVGGDVDSAIRELIDTVKAGGSKRMASEIKSALTLLPDAGKADFMVTYNLMRVFKMAMSMAPVPMPQMDIPTKSNVVFAGKISNGKMAVQIALPKEHLTEIMTAFQMMMQQKMTQQMQEQPMMMQNLWTCSMHPQVRMPQKGKCPMCGMELGPVRPQAK